MDRDIENPNTFISYRMCPPNRAISFFFTDPCKYTLYYSREYEYRNFTISKGLNVNFYEFK